MKERLIKSLNGLAIAAILMLTFYVCYYLCWFYESYDLYADVQWNYCIGMRITMLVILIMTMWAMFGLTILFFVNLRRGLKQGNIFPKNNFAVLCWQSGLSVPHFLCVDNVDFIFRNIQILDVRLKVLFVPVFLLICAMLYRLANIAAEENKLTI